MPEGDRLGDGPHRDGIAKAAAYAPEATPTRYRIRVMVAPSGQNVAIPSRRPGSSVGV